jgi:hypothetical protein
MTKNEPESHSAQEGRPERLAAVVQHSLDAIALLSREGTVEYVTPAIGEI